ncbi:MAG: GGDEF domain-containing protein [Chloroflexi bacterium]|nr:GGDEF domain-containing protein [Chloroflexota bacterium]
MNGFHDVLWLLTMAISISSFVWVIHQQRKIARFMRERVEIERQLHEKARTDFLTGLYNRAGLDETLEREAARAQRHDRPLALILIDIDSLKAVNDQYGHQAGDEVIRLVGDVLRRSLRITDIAARYGGDEFVVILPETDMDGACAVMRKIGEVVREQSIYRGLPAVVTVSMGAAEGHDAATLLDAADRAMYRGRQESRSLIGNQP